MAGSPGFRERLKENWKCIRHGRCGSRFLDCFRYKERLRERHGPIHRWTDIGLGSAVILIGIVMVPAPGPGWIIVAAGLALLAGEFEPVARGIDRAERRLRLIRLVAKRVWRRASLWVKSGYAVLGGGALAAAGYGGYLVAQALLS